MSGGEALVVGLGNRLRGDDAVGLEVARLVAERMPDVRVVEHEREPTDLIEVWEGARVAIVIDALAGEEPGRVRRLEVGQDPIGERPSPTASTHALSLSQVVELARSLNRLPARLVVIGIEGERFATGAGLSPRVEQVVEDAAELALAELGRAGEQL